MLKLLRTEANAKVNNSEAIVELRSSDANNNPNTNTNTQCKMNSYGSNLNVIEYVLFDIHT